MAQSQTPEDPQRPKRSQRWSRSEDGEATDGRGSDAKAGRGAQESDARPGEHRSDRDGRADRPEGRRGDRPERPGRGDRPERPDRAGDRRRDTRGGERGGAQRGDDRRSGGRPDQRGLQGREGRRDSRGSERGGAGRRDDRRSGGRPDRGGLQRREDRRDAEPTQRRGPRSWDRSGTATPGATRSNEPLLPDEITGKELDRAVWQQLRTLTKENAEGVARHIVASAMFLEDDPQRALEHAEHAARRAGRVPAVREALGLVRYRRGEFTDALREFKTARRLSGSEHLLPYMVDCERGLGRFERALDLANSPESRRLATNDAIELAIVVSGVRRDMGQVDAAVIGLRIPALQQATNQPWAARLLYAYADALLASGDSDGARDWFSKAATVDHEEETDAQERLAEIDGTELVELVDLSPDDDDHVPVGDDSGQDG